jgi:predicted permease
VEDLTAIRDVSRNLITGDGAVDVVQAAEITPSGFRLAHVPPLLGRALDDEDARPGAAPVLVIGYDVWHSRFASDPDVVGRHVRLGDASATIVGVMPEGFAFPVHHHYWVPLTTDSASDPATVGGGAPVFIAGRLAAGRTIADATEELAAIGAGMSAAFPATHQHLRPAVLPYVYQFAGMDATAADAFWPANLLVTLILVVVCVNVAILIYARTTTRLGEMAVRSALGASRRRLICQLVAEAAVLAIAASALGTGLVAAALNTTRAAMSSLGQTNFWTDYAMSRTAVAYAVVLAIAAAIIIGLIPAWRATGRRTLGDIRRFSGHARLGLGRTWTTLIVVQVAVASAALPLAIGLAWFQVRDVFNLPRFAVDRILFAELNVDRPGADVERLLRELSTRVAAQPAVAGQTFTTTLPNIGRGGRISVEHDTGATHDIQPATVDAGFFRTFDLGLLAGRGVDAADGRPARDVVVVNRAFAERVIRGDALGRRIRFIEPASARTAASPPAPRWLEIVGVVENIDANPFGDDLSPPRVYQPLVPGGRTRINLAVDVAPGERSALARRLPAIAAGIDSSLQLTVVPLEDVYRLQRRGLTLAAAGIGVGLLSVILLSAAGIYALLSFTVTQRRREIAIRTALGAPPSRLVGGVFGRALRQIAFGVVIGTAMALLADASVEGEALGGHGGTVIPVVVVVMGIVGLVAALGPVRRGFRIDPIAALKAE